MTREFHVSNATGNDSPLSKRKRYNHLPSPSADHEATMKKAKKGKSALTTKGFQRHFAVHNYHDYSRTTLDEIDIDINAKSKGGVHNPFPTVLHSMVSEAEANGFSTIISWQPHGRAFLIHRPKEFVELVLPKYFKHSKLSSFQRQLALYGFVRLTHDGPDRGAYYHELFLRDRPFLCCNVQRTRVKGTWVRTSSSPESEPNFYDMAPVPPLTEIEPRPTQLVLIERRWTPQGAGTSHGSYPVVSETDDHSNSSDNSYLDTPSSPHSSAASPLLKPQAPQPPHFPHIAQESILMSNNDQHSSISLKDVMELSGLDGDLTPDSTPALTQLHKDLPIYENLPMLPPKLPLPTRGTLARDSAHSSPHMDPFLYKQNAFNDNDINCNSNSHHALILPDDADLASFLYDANLGTDLDMFGDTTLASV